MRLTSKFAIVAFIAAGSTVALVHAEEATTKPAPRHEMHGPRMVGPYAKMTTLTPEEKEKIAAIHKKSVEEQKAIADKEETDIEALLTDAQKTELEQIKDEAKAKNKKEMDNRKPHGGPTTAPAN